MASARWAAARASQRKQGGTRGSSRSTPASRSVPLSKRSSAIGRGLSTGGDGIERARARRALSGGAGLGAARLRRGHASGRVPVVELDGVEVDVEPPTVLTVVAVL